MEGRPRKSQIHFWLHFPFRQMEFLGPHPPPRRLPLAPGQAKTPHPPLRPRRVGHALRVQRGHPRQQLLHRLLEDGAEGDLGRRVWRIFGGFLVDFTGCVCVCGCVRIFADLCGVVWMFVDLFSDFCGFSDFCFL